MKRYIWCVIPILYEDAPIVQERTALRVTLVARHRLPLGEDSLLRSLTPVAYGGKPAGERWFTKYAKYAKK